MNVTRRSFLYGSAAAATLPLLGRAQAWQDTPKGESGLVTGKPKELRYTAIDGFLSKDQIRWHHESHYGGALKQFVTLDAEPVGDHRSRTAKANSVVLHELYFDTMTSKKSDPDKDTHSTLKKRFGSVDRWMEDFQTAALSCQGWAVLAHHPVNGRLYNIVTNSHEDGPIWFGVPLIVLDMYEHAYYLDFQSRKGDYVKGFVEHIDWIEIEQRLNACGR